MRSLLVYVKIWVIILLTGLLIGCEDTIESPLSGTLTGRVLDKNTMTPLDNVRISTNPYSDVTETDSVGNFVMEEIEVGEYNIIATRTGYRSESITATVGFREETDVEFVLEESIKNDENPVFTGNFTPGDNEVLEELKVNFSWETLNDDSVAFELKLFENGNINTPFIYENIEDTFLTVTGLKYNTEYFWQIAAVRGNERVFTSVRSFRTLPLPSNRILYSMMTDNVMQLFVNDTIKEEPTQITFGEHHVWNGSINSQRTLFAFQSTRDVDAHLYLMDVDGTNVTRLTSFSVGSFFHNKIEYDWSPNGSQIIFSSYEYLYRINVDGTGLQTFAQAPDGKHFREVVFSPDGSRIYAMVVGSHVLDREIYQMDSNGDNMSLVYEDPGFALSGLDVGIDGQTLLFSKDVSAHVSSTGRMLDARIFELTISNGDVRDISIDKDAGTNDMKAMYSPDGSEIVFVNRRNTLSASSSVWIMEITGEGRKKLAEGGDFPFWFE